MIFTSWLSGFNNRNRSTNLFVLNQGILIVTLFYHQICPPIRLPMTQTCKLRTLLCRNSGKSSFTSTSLYFSGSIPASGRYSGFDGGAALADSASALDGGLAGMTEGGGISFPSSFFSPPPSSGLDSSLFSSALSTLSTSFDSDSLGFSTRKRTNRLIQEDCDGHIYPKL